MSSGIIDLRKGKKPPTGQQRLFAFHSAPESPKRPMPLRARRRRVRAFIAFLVLVFVAGVAYGVHVASYLPQFSVNTVSVVGASDVAPKLISDYVETILDDGSYHFLSRKNIFLYPRAAIEQAVVGFFPRIKSAKVSRPSVLSTTIEVTVEERQPFALWCGADSRCYSMDDGGFIFAEASTTQEHAGQYIFEGGIATSTDAIGQTFVRAHLAGLIALLHLLGQAGFDPRGVSVEGEQDFSIPLRDGFRIKASFGEEGTTLIKNLQLVLVSDTLNGKKDQLEYIDLRFGNRVYYKLKGQEQQSAQ